MQVETRDPAELSPNPWNTNHLTPEAELRLENAIARHGFFRPVIVRELADGALQLIGGEHRAAAAKRLGLVEIPVVNLGRIDEARAKEIGVLDNGRYGHDDAAALGRLLEELGDPAELASFMPFDMGELEAMSKMTQIDLDSLELEDEQAAPVAPPPTKAPKTHTVMRFRVPVENQALIEDLVKRIIAEQELDDSDAMVNAGDALVWLARTFLAEDGAFQ